MGHAGRDVLRQASDDDRTSDDTANGVIAPWRTDLFDDPANSPEDQASAKPRHTRSPRRLLSTAARMITPQAAAEILEASDDFRVLRRLKPRAVSEPRPLAPGEKLAIILDTETTGLDHRHDEIIELGMIAFIHDAQGAVVDVVGGIQRLA